MAATAAQAESSHYLAEAARIVRAFVSVHGTKRGLFHAAEVIGAKPSRAREMLYERARRIEAYEMDRLREAELEVIRQRLAVLDNEAAEIRARLETHR
ncbi:hypothetical protein EAH89_17185 [Roseomonas nepalensis]|uniref:Uncharacterized protein n=1 Tax=Muricoccus nepalensis TaxID=1854500 RepID=A0A502FVG5_9PROT|nr:hypothetical protein [Roseomonas nepalensis]TPG53252.1 hypothetical protein EAH89_17185 [Roseomonas nepalensis]